MTERHLFWIAPSGDVTRADLGINPTTLGSAGCGLQLEVDDAPPVAAVAQLVGDACVLRKLTRTRTIRVNGDAVDEQNLRHGDRIAIGGTDVLYAEHGHVAETMLRMVFRREDSDTAVEVQTWAPRVVVGRTDGHVHVSDGSVSGTHLEIENHGDGMRFVRDLNSTNGSELNDVPLTDRQAFTLGDTVTLGRVRVELLDGGAPPENAAPFEPRSVIWPEDSGAA